MPDKPKPDSQSFFFGVLMGYLLMGLTLAFFVWAVKQ